MTDPLALLLRGTSHVEKKDDLQTAIQGLRDHDFGIPVQITNLRD